ncbi:hypothetical protein FA13DRAFT_6029 [Coprinellus micaceus]|uniref:F-box domain-containing protein n=1 Tax=Coprinellus micaceus TaxID=71717 RepID=A0A4Y7U102_COPMI|nr:hypothetical protein FA13DRAFT_6029 [Coprinellus micaceus]
MAQLPEEVLDEVVKELGGSAATLVTLSTVSRQFVRLSRPVLFSEVVFRSVEHLLEYIDLNSAPLSTLPQTVRCTTLRFDDASALEAATSDPTKRTTIASIQVQRSLALRVQGSIPSTSLELVQTWSNIRQLVLSGEVHSPATFFASLSLFPRVGSLVLQNFTLREGVLESPERLYSLPPTLTKLSLIQSSFVLAALERLVAPGGSAIQDLHIQAVFSMDQDGVPSMLESIQNLQGVDTLTLDALDDNRDRHIYFDMTKRIFLPQTFSGISGLKHLRLNLSKVPSDVALSFLGWFTLYRPRHALELVDVYVPTAPNLWPDASPSDTLVGALAGMDLLDPVVRAPTSRRARLVVRGFPSPLPQDVQACGGSAVCGPYGYPLSFKGCNWEQMMKARLESA